MAQDERIRWMRMDAAVTKLRALQTHRRAQHGLESLAALLRRHGDFAQADKAQQYAKNACQRSGVVVKRLSAEPKPDDPI